MLHPFAGCSRAAGVIYLKTVCYFLRNALAHPAKLLSACLTLFYCTHNFFSSFLFIFCNGSIIASDCGKLVAWRLWLEACSSSKNFWQLFKYASGSWPWSSRNHGSRSLCLILLGISFVLILYQSY